MKRLLIFLAVCLLVQPFLFAQNFEDSIQEKEVTEILSFLASDELKGRGNYTPELITAGNFIAGKFREFGLQPFPGDFNFHQPFNPNTGRDIYRDVIKLNGKTLDQSQFIYLSPEIIPSSKKLSDFKFILFDGEFSDSIFLSHWVDTGNTLIVWNSNSATGQEIPLEKFRHPGFPPSGNILFISTKESVTNLELIVNKKYLANVLFNIVGVLPGKSKRNEVVIFSAHYDHIGTTSGKNASIFNGANDDASGTTAVIELAKYFSLRNDNERTIFFCAFAGEELDLYGSTYLASLLQPASVISVINIEMIGNANVGGKNCMFITGSSYSNFEKIFKQNLKEQNITIKPEPGRDLFQRSDNFSFALKGIPAHSVMCSDDYEPCYHKACDDIGRIDIQNMTRIIKAIAKGSETIISGKDTPVRINPDQFK